MIERVSRRKESLYWNNSYIRVPQFYPLRRATWNVHHKVIVSAETVFGVERAYTRRVVKADWRAM
ncbi:hypothetical protein [Mesorhizobium sp.]|uniref:hypothetical protein n=1 Tax=Mesorhizobium sp. TaxID=1871066 RepID=UPI000FE9B5E5|nr:hypothetical protein [Mesorhizobium sp.]RWQ48998.1 MAG: hypothetical protein EOS83_24735 [Mesorhizobium sp.]